MRYPERVLLVDDDEDDCMVFGIGISEISRRIEFQCNQNSESALAQLNDDRVPRPDIIFLDWNMPKVNGKDFLAAIRKNARYDEVPIVVFTTSHAKEDRESAQRLGASYFLSKPSSVQELLRSLHAILRMDWKDRAQL
jgi:DNA-binding response OmpR family regulator